MTEQLANKIMTMGREVSEEFYFWNAPSDAGDPYTVFVDFSNPVSRDTKDKFEDSYVQLITYGTDPQAVFQRDKALVAKFDQANITGMTDNFCRWVEHTGSRSGADSAYKRTSEFIFHLQNK